MDMLFTDEQSTYTNLGRHLSWDDPAKLEDEITTALAAEMDLPLGKFCEISGFWEEPSIEIQTSSMSDGVMNLICNVIFSEIITPGNCEDMRYSETRTGALEITIERETGDTEIKAVVEHLGDY